MQTFIRIHPDDKVAVALRPIPAGSTVTVDGETICVDGRYHAGT